MNDSTDLLQRYSLASDQVTTAEIRIILRELSALEGVAGDVVEFGCYIGTTSLFIQRVLERQTVLRTFHVYDSFEGLPEKTQGDLSPAGEQFQAGELAVSKKQFIEQFKKAGVRLPRIHKGWFESLTDSDIPEKIAFAFLDGDYYSSIRCSLERITPHLVPGAVIVVDDYTNEALPGAAHAVDEWLLHKKYVRIHVEQSLAILHVDS